MHSIRRVRQQASYIVTNPPIVPHIAHTHTYSSGSTKKTFGGHCCDKLERVQLEKQGILQKP